MHVDLIIHNDNYRMRSISKLHENFFLRYPVQYRILVSHWPIKIPNCGFFSTIIGTNSNISDNCRHSEQLCQTVPGNN